MSKEMTVMQKWPMEITISRGQRLIAQVAAARGTLASLGGGEAPASLLPLQVVRILFFLRLHVLQQDRHIM